ncbi:MAG: hypothetical protein FWD57_16845, partial [Polyangiaceae bacterium]|nr:hypothetical protein [Polyangiaceae bacterium]
DPLAVHSPGAADLNLYAYVSGSSLRMTDPVGLDIYDRIGGALKAFNGVSEAIAGASLMIGGFKARGGPGAAAMAGGSVVLAHGVDQAQAGVRQMVSGVPVDSLTSLALQEAGMSRRLANDVEVLICVVGITAGSAGTMALNTGVRFVASAAGASARGASGGGAGAAPKPAVGAPGPAPHPQPSFPAPQPRPSFPAPQPKPTLPASTAPPPANAGAGASSGTSASTLGRAEIATGTEVALRSESVVASSGRVAAEMCVEGGASAVTRGTGPTYKIMDGVRRAKAAQELGHTTIPGTIQGQGGGVVDLPIASLRSPKDVIWLNNPVATQRWLDTMRSTTAGSRPPPIEVMKGTQGTPVYQVQIRFK